MTVIEESRPFAQQLSNVYFTILSLFCFKLFVKISLAILSHFYIVKGNRKEAARIAAEFYGVPQGQVLELLCLLSFGLVPIDIRFTDIFINA
ncbi:ankyrin repeat and socs box protein 5 isoform x1 [Limosa lapponica baueri]|uniref:Ankyrin repeat and socs box protein 5 isoform x1 n=1 Tax=Limosa lapponica baueri TaxID=1758121 RepID=A0A2I0TAG3_LIMLA|nr:ankyrin repeat and socs box protein 5 isoform x1 [Limosa lapponica baueri]